MSSYTRIGMTAVPAVVMLSAVVSLTVSITPVCGQSWLRVLDKPDLGLWGGVGCEGTRRHPGEGDEVSGQVGLVVVARLHRHVGQRAARRQPAEQRTGMIEAQQPCVGLRRDPQLAPKVRRDVAPAPAGLVHEG